MLLGFRSIVLALAGCSCTGLALGGGGCVVAPPAELPPLVQLPPRILHDSVVPPQGVPLPAWPIAPNALLVPVVVDDPSRTYDYRVFVDYAQWQEPVSPTPSLMPAADGGVILSISINPQQPNRVIDLGACHEIKVVVAHSFLPLQNNATPDSLVGDSVFWPYYPSSDPYTCTVQEAGAAAASIDGSPDVLPIPPASEGGEL